MRRISLAAAALAAFVLPLSACGSPAGEEQEQGEGGGDEEEEEGGDE